MHPFQIMRSCLHRLLFLFLAQVQLRFVTSANQYTLLNLWILCAHHCYWLVKHLLEVTFPLVDHMHLLLGRSTMCNCLGVGNFNVRNGRNSRCGLIISIFQWKRDDGNTRFPLNSFRLEYSLLDRFHSHLQGWLILSLSLKHMGINNALSVVSGKREIGEILHS